MFRKWSVELLRSLIAYLDPERVTFASVLQVNNKDRLLELLEYATDLKVFHHKPDRASSLELGVLFPKLKDLYQKSGSRF